LKEIEIWKSLQHEKFFYGGLVICGSVWDCPVCTVKISEKRKVEIDEAIKIHEARGGVVFMRTLTFPHYANQSTSANLKKFAEARKKMFNRKPHKRLFDALKIVGSITRTEVTYGENGAHIHCHELFFSDFPFSVHVPSESFYPMWKSACVDSGLDAPSELHGVKISTPKEMAEYVSKVGKEASKWTVALEMTKGHIKQGKFEGMTPFDLLRAYRDTGDCDYAEQFSEYSRAFKGKRQLVWSEGLRDRLGVVVEKSDLEVATEIEDTAFIFSLIDSDLWKIIRKNNLRVQLLASCYQGIDGLKSFIQSIR
jgi:hypothetical protein